MLQYKCPFCEQRNTVRAEALGTTRKCKACLRPVDVPQAKDQQNLDRQMRAELLAYEEWRKLQGIGRQGKLLFVLIIGGGLLFVCCVVPLMLAVLRTLFPRLDI
jgi:hypothetical protein